MKKCRGWKKGRDEDDGGRVHLCVPIEAHEQGTGGKARRGPREDNELTIRLLMKSIKTPFFMLKFALET
jgi:hypothetical protein